MTTLKNEWQTKLKQCAQNPQRKLSLKHNFIAKDKARQTQSKLFKQEEKLVPEIGFCEIIIIMMWVFFDKVTDQMQ